MKGKGYFEQLADRRKRGVELYKKGWNQYQIAEALGVTQPSVSKWVRAEAAGGDATLIFVDESGFDLSPHVSRGWAPVGETPVVKFQLRGGRLSAISGVTLDGELYFRMYDHSIRAKEVSVFVRHIARQISGPIDLIWDGSSTHRAREVELEIDMLWTRLDVHRFPAYAPELNPDEYLWNWLKNKKLVNCVNNFLMELGERLRRAVRTIRRRPEIIRSFYKASLLSCH
jgi:transposase